MKPDGNINGPQKLRRYSDADYSGDNHTQKRVTGYIVLINGAIISWRPRIHKPVTISVTEYEYLSITELCCKILFFHAKLLFMGVVVVEYFITVHVDNFGATFLSENTLVSQKTNQVEVRYHFIHDYVEDEK